MNKKKYFLLIIIIALTTCSSSLYEKNWHDVSMPTSAKSQVYGSYTAGCMDGASYLPKAGKGYKTVSNVNRNYGHPSLVRTIEKLGKWVDKKYERILLVGDLAHPRGGPTSIKTSAHRSHQNGLDVDIWFNMIKEDEKPKNISVLTPGKKRLRLKYWRDRNVATLKKVASFNEVERVLVNPHVKKDMCKKYKGANWLKKIRPWWGHHKHFHVRLRCPKDSKYCKSQEPTPDHDGCDDELDWWFSKEASTMGKTKSKEKRVYPNLPAQCESVFKWEQKMAGSAR